MRSAPSRDGLGPASARMPMARRNRGPDGRWGTSTAFPFKTARNRPFFDTGTGGQRSELQLYTPTTVTGLAGRRDCHWQERQSSTTDDEFTKGGSACK